MGEPIISLRNPEGSEVLPVGTSAGPFSVIVSGDWVRCDVIEWNGVEVMLEAQGGEAWRVISGRHSLYVYM